MGRISHRVRRAGAVWWSIPAEVRALRVPGITHAAYLGLSDGRLGERAVLCVETVSGRLSPGQREALDAAMGPIPRGRRPGVAAHPA